MSSSSSDSRRSRSTPMLVPGESIAVERCRAIRSAYPGSTIGQRRRTCVRLPVEID